MTPEATVFVVDDDEAVRLILHELISSVGLRVETYASAQGFLDAYKPGLPGCLLLDIRMPGMSGLELQRELARREIPLPVIILTGHGDVPVAVHAMKAGAFDFIEKPFNNDFLLDRIQNAVAQSMPNDATPAGSDEVVKRLQLLTRRERQVLDLVFSGKTSREIAHQLDVSDNTVYVHRTRMMKKMRAKSVASLMRMLAAVAHDPGVRF
jgi:FixJ family two-component response regulator